MGRIFVAGLCFFAAAAMAESFSDRVQWLEYDVRERVEFVRSHNHIVNQRVESSGNYKPISQWLRQLYDVESIKQVVALDPLHRLQLVDRGLARPTELLQVGPRSQTLLFSNDWLKANNSFTIRDFSVSPQKRFVAIWLWHHGSIDEGQIYFYDLKKRALLAHTLATFGQFASWWSAHELLYYDNHWKAHLYDVETQTSTQWTEDSIFSPLVAGFLIYSHGNKQTLHDSLRNQDYLLENPADEIIGADAQTVYMRSDERIFRLNLSDKTAAQLIRAEDKTRFLSEAQVLDGRLILSEHYGPQRWLKIYSTDLQRAQELEIPNCCSITNLKWKEVGLRLSVELVSAVTNRTEFIYDLTRSQWESDPAIMLTTPRAQYETHVVFYPSPDGTPIPLRLTYRADLQPDGHRPVWFASYGGFGLSGLLDPFFTRSNEEFLRRGGVLAAAGLRGGNEYGEDWHQAARKTGKMKTFEDLAAAAQYVIAQGLTQPGLIISSGGSNGGLTVAATALLNPNTFGLVIPFSGVFDMLGKERMDERNSGWDFEFGSADDLEMREFLTRISPVELAAASKATSRFLILDGVLDSRVNMAHSLKLQAALESQQSPAELYSLKNAGHWLGMFLHQDLIAWRVAVVQWTTIFEQLNWTF